jgi:hypothetical protein
MKEIKQLEEASKSIAKVFYLRFFYDKEVEAEAIAKEEGRSIESIADEMFFEYVEDLGHIYPYETVDITGMIFNLEDMILFLKSKATYSNILKHWNYIISYEKDKVNLKHWLVANKLATFKDLAKDGL